MAPSSLIRLLFCHPVFFFIQKYRYMRSLNSCLVHVYIYFPKLCNTSISEYRCDFASEQIHHVVIYWMLARRSCDYDIRRCKEMKDGMAGVLCAVIVIASCLIGKTRNIYKRRPQPGDVSWQQQSRLERNKQSKRTRKNYGPAIAKAKKSFHKVAAASAKARSAIDFDTCTVTGPLLAAIKAIMKTFERLGLVRWYWRMYI